MDLVEFFDLVICSPDRGQTGCLCGHNVHTDTEVSGKISYAVSHELHDFIIDITIGKYGTDNGQCNILRTNALLRLTGQIYSDHARHIDIICTGKKLFYKLRTTLAHCHGTKGTVTCMGIGTKDHLTTLCQHLTGILVNDCLMRRNIDAAVFLSTGKTKHVIVLVDGSTYCAETVMTVCQNIWDREFFQSGCTRCLNDSDKCNIVRCQFVELDLKLLHIARGVMSL